MAKPEFLVTSNIVFEIMRVRDEKAAAEVLARAGLRFRFIRSHKWTRSKYDPIREVMNEHRLFIIGQTPEAEELIFHLAERLSAKQWAQRRLGNCYGQVFIEGRWQPGMRYRRETTQSEVAHALVSLEQLLIAEERGELDERFGEEAEESLP